MVWLSSAGFRFHGVHPEAVAEELRLKAQELPGEPSRDGGGVPEITGICLDLELKTQWFLDVSSKISLK